MGYRPSIITLALFVALPAAADEPLFQGVSVVFRDSRPETRARVHEKLGTRVDYHSELQKIDLVSLPDEAQNHSKRALESLCAQYLKDPGVEGCQINRRLQWSGAGTALTPPCPPAGPNLMQSTEVSPILEVAQKAGECKPFPDQIDSGRGPLDDKIQGKLTPYWAQEAVGAPEAHELMKQIDQSNAEAGKPPVAKVNVGILDGGFSPAGMPANAFSPSLKACIAAHPDGIGCGVAITMAAQMSGHPPGFHGTAVSHLIAGDSPVGVGSKGQLDRLATADAFSYVEAADRMASSETGPPPSIVNMSMGIPDGPALAKSIDTLASRTVLVIASGNEFPDPINSTTRKAPAIVVGSVQPNGLASNFSKEGSEVTISAPSDLTIQSKGADGKDTSFSGTSGATPVVTGALTDAMSLLPGLTTDEAKLLLQNTAILTPGTGDGKNGAGSLNAYGMLKVAQRLHKSWPKNRDELRKSGTYDFKPDSDHLAEQARKLLANPSSCNDQIAGLRTMRMAFFLNPSNGEIRHALAELYRTKGYASQALFYEDPAKSFSDPVIAQGRKNRDLIRAIGRGELKEIDRLLTVGAEITARGGGEHRDSRVVQIAAREIQDPARLHQVVELLMSKGATVDPEDTLDDMHAVAWAATHGFPSLTESLLKRGAKADELDSNNLPVLTAVAEKGGPESAKIAALLLDHGADPNQVNPITRSTAITTAILSGNKDVVRVLVAHHADLSVKYGDLSLEQLATEAGHPEIVSILKGAN